MYLTAFQAKYHFFTKILRNLFFILTINRHIPKIQLCQTINNFYNDFDVLIFNLYTYATFVAMKIETD